MSNETPEVVVIETAPATPESDALMLHISELKDGHTNHEGRLETLADRIQYYIDRVDDLRNRIEALEVEDELEPEPEPESALVEETIETKTDPVAENEKPSTKQRAYFL